MTWLAIALGGALGVMGRHALNAAVHVRYSVTFPWGTFAVNALGCFVIGLLAGLLAAARVHIGEFGRAFIFVGILGGFTTFSTFGLDTFTLVKSGAAGSAVANVVGQVVVGLSAVWVGYELGSWRG